MLQRIISNLLKLYNNNRKSKNNESSPIIGIRNVRRIIKLFSTLRPKLI